MVDRRELKWFGHQITMERNRKHRQVWETRVEWSGEEEG